MYYIYSDFERPSLRKIRPKTILSKKLTPTLTLNTIPFNPFYTYIHIYQLIDNHFIYLDTHHINDYLLKKI